MALRQHISEYSLILAKASEIDVARLAAFIDGEGSIAINQSLRLVGRSKTPRHNLNLVISNTNVSLIDWLEKTFAGSVYFVKYENCKHLGKKQTMRWQVNDRKALAVLERCLPYMIVKVEQAKVAIAFMGLKRTNEGFGMEKLTDSELQKRCALRLQIQRLNQDGGAVRIN